MPTNYSLAEARHIVLRLSAAAVRFDCGPRHHAELDGFGLEVPEACSVPPRSILQAAAGHEQVHSDIDYRIWGKHQEFSPALFAPTHLPIVACHHGRDRSCQGLGSPSDW